MPNSHRTIQNPRAIGYRVKYTLKIVLSLAWAFPIGLAAMVAFLGIITIPIGVVLMHIACIPFYMVQKKDVKIRSAWKFRETDIMFEENERPWK